METGSQADQGDRTSAAPSPTHAKRAVVVIHGIGNQSPMTTLRGFVEAVWTSASGLARGGEKPRTWAKRDPMSGNYELRRITTNYDTGNRRTDFFEFYWAHMMEDTRLSSVLWWVQRLLMRRPNRVPPAVREAWIAGIVAVLAAFALLIVFGLLCLAALRADSFWCAVAWLAGAAAIAIVLWILRHRVLVEVVGDAARYLTADPQNIAARSRIRNAGIKLLAELHDNPDYDRIVLVCHSLGTVIGYDLLNFYWSTVNEYFRHEKGKCPALTQLEERIGELREAPDDPARLENFRQAQRDYSKIVCATIVEEEGKQKTKWKVTDFVTLGSPLTHAHFLMVDDASRLLPSDKDIVETEGLWTTAWQVRLDDVTREVAAVFSARAAQRDFPLCPPLNEAGNAFTYGDHVAVPHHAAVFGPVRWTNLYAPCVRVIWGDVIGGKLRPIFGPGVKDVPLTGAVGRRRFAHTHYWDLAKDGASSADVEHIEALRAALNLLDLSEKDAWSGYTGKYAPRQGGPP
jgi:hypothetical protein